MPTPSNPALAILLGAMQGVVGELPTVYDNLKNQNTPAQNKRAAAEVGGVPADVGGVPGDAIGTVKGSRAGPVEGSFARGEDYYYNF